MEQPTVPSVPATIRAYARRFFRGDASGWRAAPLTVVFIFGMMLMAVPVWRTEQALPFIVPLVAGVAALDGGFREHRAGGSPTLVSVAGATTALMTFVGLLPFAAVRVAIGGPLPIPYIDVMLAIGVIGLLVAYIAPGRKHAEERLEAELLAERARRGSGSA